MDSLPGEVTIMTCSTPASTASSTTYWSMGLVQDGQQFFGQGLGHGQEAGAQSGGGDDGFPNLHSGPSGSAHPVIGSGTRHVGMNLPGSFVYRDNLEHSGTL